MAPRTNGTPVTTALAAPAPLKVDSTDVDGVFTNVDDVLTDVGGATVVAGSVVGTLGDAVGVTDSVTDVRMTEGRI